MVVAVYLLTGRLKVRMDRAPEAAPMSFHAKQVKVIKDSQIKVAKEEVEKLVAVGDCAALTRPLKKLMGNRITGTALDDRAGCACVIRAAQLANEQNPDCCVMVLCSTTEEVGGQGAQVSA